MDYLVLVLEPRHCRSCRYCRWPVSQTRFHSVLLAGAGSRCGVLAASISHVPPHVAGLWQTDALFQDYVTPLQG